MIEIMSSEIALLLPSSCRRSISFEAGEPIFHLGDKVRFIYIVRSGLIHLFRDQENGARLMLQRAEAGSILAEPSLFSDTYHCNAVAVRMTEAWSISRDVIRDRLRSGGVFAEAWTKHLGNEVQRSRLQSEILSIRQVSARLDAWLVWHGSLPAKGGWITLAAEIGVSPEALYREIGRRKS